MKSNYFFDKLLIDNEKKKLGILELNINASEIDDFSYSILKGVVNCSLKNDVLTIRYLNSKNKPILVNPSDFEIVSRKFIKKLQNSFDFKLYKHQKKSSDIFFTSN